MNGTGPWSAAAVVGHNARLYEAHRVEYRFRAGATTSYFGRAVARTEGAF
jgi:hypothetical protein